MVWDANGNVLGRQDYAPFGRALFPVPAIAKEGFGAQEKDAETDQGYFHARMLQEWTGRFAAPDPIGAGLFVPQRWNRYAYSLNNPTSYTDYSGLLAYGALSCENSALWQEFRCSLGDLFEQSQTGGVIVRGTQGTGGATASKPTNQPPTTTETETETEPENYDDCHEFTETITETVAGRSVTQRAFNFKASGIPLMTAGFYKAWSREGSKMAGTMGVRPGLVANNQGTDAYAHIAFLVGAAADFSPAILPFIGLDAYEAAKGRPESVTELKDDFAGILVAGALGFGVVTGDATTTKRLVNTIVCGSK